MDQFPSGVWITFRAAGSTYPALFPTLAANADGFGLAWSDSRDGNAELYFARLDDAGLLLGAEVRVTNEPLRSADPSMVWTGSGYGVTWDDIQDDQAEILFGQLDEAGALLGGVVSVTDSQGHSWFPSVAWSGTRYGVAWRHHDEGENPTRFVTIAP